MSDVLDQAEIDALLAAVDGEAESDAESDAGTDSASAATIVSQAPIFSDIEADQYDFKRPERVSKEQIRSLASIHEAFARNFGATLSGFLRTIVDVRVVGVEQLTYNEFIHSLPNPTAFIILNAPPLDGQICLELSPLVAFPLLDRLLGGANASRTEESPHAPIPKRPLTSIEWRLVRRITERALENLAEVWRNLVEIKFDVETTESNPQLVHIVAPTEVVVFVTFEVKLGHSTGTMSLCIPFNAIESVLSRLTSQSWFYKPKPATDLHQQRIRRSLERSNVGLAAYLGRSRITLGELRNLREGDLIPLEKRVDQQLILQIEGRNKFAGSVGQLRGRRALRLTRHSVPDEPL